MNAVADARFIIALIDKNHPENYRCKKVFQQCHIIYATTNTTAEVLKLLREQTDETAEIEFIRRLPEYRLRPTQLEWQDIGRAKYLAHRYKAVDFRAAVTVALAERLGLETILTLEHDRYDGTRLNFPGPANPRWGAPKARRYKLIAPPNLEPSRFETIAIYVFVDSDDDARSKFTGQIADDVTHHGEKPGLLSSALYRHYFDDDFCLYFFCLCQNQLFEHDYLQYIFETINDDESHPGSIWLIDHRPDQASLNRLIQLGSLLKKPIVVAINETAPMDENELHLPASFRIVGYNPDDKESIKNVLLVLCDEVLKDIARDEAFVE